jgi:hypothetical protein
MDSDTLVDAAMGVTSKEDFIAFLGSFISNLRSNPDDLENADLESFMVGMQGFLSKSEKYYANTGQSDVDASMASWRIFADAIMAARVYE